MEISPLVFRKINAHAFKNVGETVFGFLVGPKDSDNVVEVLPVTHLRLNSCNLHTAFTFLEKFLKKIDIRLKTEHGITFILCS